MEAKEIKELVYKYCSSQYDHIANEPQFDCKMVDFNEVDLYDMIGVITKESHNAALDLAAEEATATIQQEWEPEFRHAEVDTQSITNLKIK